MREKRKIDDVAGDIKYTHCGDRAQPDHFGAAETSDSSNSLYSSTFGVATRSPVGAREATR